MNKTYEIDHLRDQIKKCDQSKPYVFVSYSSDDKEKVYRDIIKLQALGVNVWIDKELDSRAGEEWNQVVLKAIKKNKCKMLIFYISGSSMTSPQVLKELLATKSKGVIMYNQNKPLPIIPVDLEKLEENNISKWVTEELVDYDDEFPTNKKFITVQDANGEDLTFKVDNRYEVSYIILEEIFGNSNAQTRINGYRTHDEIYYFDLIDNLRNKTDEKNSVVANKTDKNEVNDISQLVDEPDHICEGSSTVSKLNSNKIRTRKKFTYELYGKSITSNTSDLMRNVFIEVLRQHEEVHEDLHEKLSCVSNIDYTKPENKEGMPTTFNYCFTIETNGKGDVICVGTTYSSSSKLKFIAMLLEICNEPFDILTLPEDMQLPDVAIKSRNKSERVIKLYDEIENQEFIKSDQDVYRRETMDELIYYPSASYEAKISYANERFVLKMDSVLSRPSAQMKDMSFANKYNKIIDDFITDGLATEENGIVRLLDDMSFKSPSQPAKLVAGYSVNGWTFFKGLDQLRNKK